MKKTKRKAFNFLRSYFDVLNELNKDSDKLSFLMAIINKQFLNEDPKDLEFIAKLCYESQRHSIESSIKGWMRVAKTDIEGNLITNPISNPKTNPKTNPQEVEVEEKEEVQVQEKDKEEENYFFNFSDELFNDPQWNEDIRRLNKISSEKLLKYLDIFDLSLKSKLLKITNKKEYANYFTNWISIEIKKQQNTLKNGKQINNNTGADQDFRDKTAQRLGLIKS